MEEWYYIAYNSDRPGDQTKAFYNCWGKHLRNMIQQLGEPVSSRLIVNGRRKYLEYYPLKIVLSHPTSGFTFMTGLIHYRYDGRAAWAAAHMAKARLEHDNERAGPGQQRDTYRHFVAGVNIRFYEAKLDDRIPSRGHEPVEYIGPFDDPQYFQDYLYPTAVRDRFMPRR